MTERVNSDKLPREFKERMEGFLGDEYGRFLQSYERERAQALRVNTLKIGIQRFGELSPFSLRPVPWTQDGFYFEKGERPGRHPYHEAGLYYIQEPSAMATGVLAEAKPGERVLDLCAAPGGKTAQLAAAMEGRGLLVANEIHPARARILSQNVERLGIRNAVVTNESPQALAERFPAFFDRIVVDAPCSGEGMFLKEEQACAEWSLANVAMCAARQQEILAAAAQLLRPGGTLVYSTCTFAPEEDEGSVGTFLQSHPAFSVKKVRGFEGFGPGRPEWAAAPPQTADTFRLWPHRLEGEGHYVAVLQKSAAGGSDPVKLSSKLTSRGEESRRKQSAGKAEKAAWQLFTQFAADTLRSLPEGVPVLFGEQLYLLPEELSLKGLKVVRAGLQLGVCRKDRFEPSHALALALRAEDVLRCYSLKGNGPEVEAYLKGQTLARPEGEKGWCLVLAEGYSLGWGKWIGGALKNHYPKGLRRP